MNILIIEDEYSLADAVAETMLPKKNGFEILNYLRQEKIKTPVIMLTAKSEIEDKLNGLENGADEYITKPFSMRELMVRVKAVLKRTNNIEDTNCLEFGDLVLDVRNAKLKCNDNEIQIGGKELEFLEQFLLNKNQVISRENLVERIWGYESDAEYNNVDQKMDLQALW